MEAMFIQVSNFLFNFWIHVIVDSVQNQIKTLVRNNLMIKPSTILLGVIIFSMLLVPMVIIPSAAIKHVNHGPVPFPPSLIPSIDIHKATNHHMVKHQQNTQIP
jgi:hypothetical protein